MSHLDARFCNGDEGENGVGTRTLKPSMLAHHHQNMNGMDGLDLITGNPDAGGTETKPKRPRNGSRKDPWLALADPGGIAD